MNNNATPELRDTCKPYHEAYCAATGLKVLYNMEYYSDYYLFAKDFSPEDIQLVVKYLRKLYKDKPEILRASLRISKLIRERARFGEFLAEAKAEARAPVKNPATKAREAWRGLPEEPEEAAKDTSKPIGQILPHVQRGIELLRQCKKDLKP